MILVMILRAVLFDAAETLFTTRVSVGSIYGSLAREYGSEASNEAIHAAFLRHFRGAGPVSPENQKNWWKDIVHRVFSDVGMVRDFDRFFEQVYDSFRDSQNWRLFPETQSVLQELKSRGLKLGIVSNFDDRIYSVMRSLDILAFFDVVTISSEAGYCKPDVRIFETAVRAMSVPPAAILFVGDSLHDDVEAGLQAGLQAVLVDRNGHHASANNVWKVASLDQILDFASLPRR